MINGRLIPANGEYRIDITLRYSTCALSQLLRKTQDRLHFIRDDASIATIQKGRDRSRLDAQTFGGCRVYTAAIPTSIQSGDICGDKLAFTFRERRRPPKKGLVEHNQRLVGLRKHPEDIEKRGVFRQ